MVIKAQENPRLFFSSGWTQNIITKCDPMRILAGLIDYKTTRNPRLFFSRGWTQNIIKKKINWL